MIQFQIMVGKDSRISEFKVLGNQQIMNKVYNNEEHI